jgi:site-specific recombinase XerD
LGTKLADEGESPEMVAQVLGHTDTKTTKKYARYGTRALKPFFKRRNMSQPKIVTKSLPMKK